MTLLEELEAIGIKVSLQGDGLAVYPASRPTPELRERLKAQKSEVLALLKAKGQTTVTQAPTSCCQTPPGSVETSRQLHAATTAPVGISLQPLADPAVQRFSRRFDAFAESATNLTGLPVAELPTRRCHACNTWLFWVSVYGAVICAHCHPPANPGLVRRWYWLPEGECKTTQ